MATKKVTITLEEHLVDEIRQLTEAGGASSVSGFVQHAVRLALDDVAGWQSMLAEAVDDSGGALTADEAVWADSVLGLGGGRAA